MDTTMSRSTSFGILLLLALVTLAGVPTAAWAQATFMQVPGIAGGSTDDGHPDWIDVVSLRQSWPTIKKTGCEVEVVKGLDIAGPRLWAAAVTQLQFQDIVIEVERADGGKLYDLHLRGAQITAVVTSSPGNAGSPFESVTILPTRMDLSFYPQDPDGSPGAPITNSIACN